LTHFIFLL